MAWRHRHHPHGKNAGAAPSAPAPLIHPPNDRSNDRWTDAHLMIDSGAPAGPGTEQMIAEAAASGSVSYGYVDGGDSPRQPGPPAEKE